MTTSTKFQKKWYQCYHAFRKEGYRPAASAFLATGEISGDNIKLSSFISDTFNRRQAG